MDSHADHEAKATRLVGWTCAWMQALPVATMRALKEDEKELLRQIFLQVLSDKRVDLTSRRLQVPATMSEIRSD